MRDGSNASLTSERAAIDRRIPAIKNPEFLRDYAETRGFAHGLPSSITITPDNRAVLFLRSGARSFVRDLYEFDTRTGEERVLLTADQILQGAEEQLSAEEKARRERQRMTARGISSYELSQDGSKILIPLSGRLFVYDREMRSVNELKGDYGFPLDPRLSPNAKMVACVREGDLYVTKIARGEERRLTTKPGDHVTNGLSEFVAQEEMDRDHGYWWSPDSQYIAYQQTDTSMVERLHIADAFNPEQPPQSWPYPRPGKNNAEVKLGVIPAAGGETRWIDWDKQSYPYLATVRWEENAPLTLVVENRNQTWLAIMIADAESGATTILHTERDPAWLNLDQSMPKWFPDGRAFLWTTEKNGITDLEMRGPRGHLIKQLAAPAIPYRGFVSIRDDCREVVVYGSLYGLDRQLFAKSTIDSVAPHAQGFLNAEFAVRTAVYSKDHSLRVEWSNGLEGRSCYLLTGADRSNVELKAVAELPPFKPNVELTTIGEYPIYVAIIRPRDFDPGKRYPVIDSAYGGPHANVVTANMYAYLLDQWLADQGFIVVRIDGRGTPNRGRDWERAIKGNFIEKPLEDHVSALKALGEKYREMDMSRVGVYGWSFGGYFAAMAVMQQPDVYHAGVAGAPVCDWKDYDTHYTERYLGLPDEHPEAYEASSVLTYADRLERPLLIIHGTTDDNVYFTHALKMSNALLRAGKPHEFLPLSNFTHMVADPNVAEQINTKIARFFLSNLGTPN